MQWDIIKLVCIDEYYLNFSLKKYTIGLRQRAIFSNAHAVTAECRNKSAVALCHRFSSFFSPVVLINVSISTKSTVSIYYHVNLFVINFFNFQIMSFLIDCNLFTYCLIVFKSTRPQCIFDREQMCQLSIYCKINISTVYEKLNIQFFR